MGAEVGQSTLDVSKDDLDDLTLTAINQSGLFVTSASSSLDDSDTTYGVFVGYRFLPFLAAELAWFDMGTASYSGSGIVSDGLFSAQLDVDAEAEVSGPALSLLGIYPINDRWEVFGRAGVLFAETELSFSASFPGLASESASVSTDTEELLWGAGIAYNFNSNVGVRVEYTQVLDVGDDDETGEGDVDRIVLNLSYSF